MAKKQENVKILVCICLFFLSSLFFSFLFIKLIMLTTRWPRN